MDTTTSIPAPNAERAPPRYAIPEFLLQRDDDSDMMLDQQQEQDETTMMNSLLYANMNPSVRALFKNVSLAVDAQSAETITKLKHEIAICERKIAETKRGATSRKEEIAINLTYLDETIAKTFSVLSADQTLFYIKVPTNFAAYSHTPISMEALRKSQPGVVEMLEETAQFLKMQGKVPSIFLDPKVSHLPNTDYDYRSDEHWIGGTHIVLKCQMAAPRAPPRKTTR
jgi:hypothetical protein